MNRTWVGIGAGVIVLGGGGAAAWALRGGAEPPARAPAAGGAVEVQDIAPIWRPERRRWCGLVEVGLHPASAGRTIHATFEHRRQLGGAGSQWFFKDDAGALALQTDAAACFTSVNYKGEPGYYRFEFALPTDAVARDAGLDARSVDDDAWRACPEAEPEDHPQDLRVVTVVDTDGTVWTSDGTRDEKGLRTCLAAAHNAWVKAQLAEGTLGIDAPAIVVGTLPGWRPPLPPG